MISEDMEATPTTHLVLFIDGCTPKDTPTSRAGCRASSAWLDSAWSGVDGEFPST